MHRCSMHDVWHLRCRDLPEAGVLHSAEMWVQTEGDHILGRFFFCCPENRPWFPGTMQLMRVSPRKIRLWHHGFLKHTAEPTLSPAIIKPQWISTVDWNWERGRISSLSTFFFSHTCVNLTANIPVAVRGSRCTCWTLVSLFPFTSGLGSRWQ